ncbi:MAG: ethyl tert-butyl ether degradation protein EthD [Burkholderiales bacterium]|nr:ethyl tert-butyl ether degradation protein EthD [Burkholderiales bacterium]
MFSLFLVFDERLPIDDALLASTGMRKAHVYTPVRASDPLLDEAAPPPLVLQVYFDELTGLEAACRGPFARLGGSVIAQAMAVRRYPVPVPADPKCTYLVAYDGPAEDERAWLAHYLAHHPPLMARLPGIRELEIYIRVDWVAPAAWRRATCMQRNKVAFDSAGALAAALSSPIRLEMRADFRSLPPFSGAVTHYPMATRVVRPA